MSNRLDYLVENAKTRESAVEILKEYLNKGPETRRSLIGATMVFISLHEFTETLFGKNGLVLKDWCEDTDFVVKLQDWKLTELKELAYNAISGIDEYITENKWLIDEDFLVYVHDLKKLFELLVLQSEVKESKLDVEESKLDVEELEVKEEKQVEIVEPVKEVKVKAEIPTFTCLEKIKGKGNKIIAYKLADSHGNSSEIETEKLKTALSLKKVKITNLKLSGGRIINK